MSDLLDRMLLGIVRVMGVGLRGRLFVVDVDQVNRVLSIGSVVVLCQFACKDLLVGDFSLPE